MSDNVVKVRFPNESTWIEMVNFNWWEFIVDKEFHDEIFGWYHGSYVAVVKN
jgi:hypothetical protein